MGMQADLIQRVLSRQEEVNAAIKDKEEAYRRYHEASQKLVDSYDQLRNAMLPNTAVAYRGMVAIRDDNSNIKLIPIEDAN